jgi:hypothetical protein
MTETPPLEASAAHRLSREDRGDLLTLRLWVGTDYETCQTVFY